MPRGERYSGLAQGFALADQSFRAGEAAAINRAQLDMMRDEHRQKQLERSMQRAAGMAEMIMRDPKTGLLDASRLASAEGRDTLNTLLQQDPTFASAFADAFTKGSPAEAQGFKRVPVGFEPAARQVGQDEEGRPQFQEIPGAVTLRTRWVAPDGTVKSEGPMTVNGTNDPNDKVVTLTGNDLQKNFLGLVGAYSPELRASLASSWEKTRDLSAMKTLAGIQPQSETVVTQAPTKAAPVSNATPVVATAPAAPSAPTAPVDIKAAKPDIKEEDATRFDRVRAKMYDELKTAADELAALKAPGPEENHQGARQAAYQQAVQEKTAEITKLSAKYKDLHDRFGVPVTEGVPPGAKEIAVPSTVPADQVPKSAVDQPRIQVAAAQTPEQAAPGLQSLQTVVKKRGAPKLNDEQKDALAWLAARGKISIEQYDQVLRTGRLAPKVKSVVGDGLGGLYTVDAEGNVTHIEGTYSKMLVASKFSKGKGGAGGIELADKQADFLKNHYGFLAMRPGAKGGADTLDSNRFNTMRDNLLVSSASLGFDPYTPQAITMVSKAKQLQDGWAKENAPAWTNLWLRDKKDFNSYTPGIIAAKFGKDMDTVMNQYYAPLRALMGKDADQVPGQTADGFALVMAGLEARGLSPQDALAAAQTLVQSGRLSAFSSPEQVLAAADQALAAQ